MSALLPALKGRRVCLFDCASLRCVGAFSVEVPSTDSYFGPSDLGVRTTQALVLASGNVLILYYCVGTTAYVADPAGNVVIRTVAAEASHYAGVVEFDGGVFTFGGTDYEEGSTVSRRLDLATGAWKRVKDLTEVRFHINPALWADRIYICGGTWSTGTIDEYIPRTNLMVPLAVKLPERDSPAAAFLDGGELVVFSNHFVARFRKASGGLRLVGTKEFREGFDFENLLTNPVMCGRKVFFIEMDRKVGWWTDSSTREEMGRFVAADFE